MSEAANDDVVDRPTNDDVADDDDDDVANKEEEKEQQQQQQQASSSSVLSRKQLLLEITTSGMEGGGGDDDEDENENDTTNNKQRNVDAFYQVLWPILEKEGGWTLVKGTGQEEGATIFCPPNNNNSSSAASSIDIAQIISNDLLLAADNDGDDDDDDDTTSHQTPPVKHHQHHHHHQQQLLLLPPAKVPELANQQGPWTCVCGITNDEGTIRCEECFGWREASSVIVVEGNTTTNTTNHKKKEYYTKIRQVIRHTLLQKETNVETKAAEAYTEVITNAMELFGSTTTSNNNNDDDDNHHHHHHNNHHVPMSPNTRMTRQRFSDIAWKENRTHYEKSSSRVGNEYQVDVLPKVGSHTDTEEEVLYDQVWDPEKATQSGKIDFIHHRVKSSIKEPAYNMLHQRDYRLSGFFNEVSKADPTDCSHWTSEERAKFRKLVFDKHEDMWQISEALGRPVRECVTYYLGKFKTSKDFRSLRRVMEKARDENPFKYPGEILCDKCGKGGKLVYCDSCDCHYHLTCQDPPLTEVPEGNDWKCNKCVESKNTKEAMPEEEEEEEVMSNGTGGGGEVATEMDTSNGDEEAEVSSFEGKRSYTNDDDAGLISTGNDNQGESNNKSAEEEAAAAEPANDANAKRPSSGESPNNNANDDVPQPQAKKAKSNSSEESMTSYVSGEVASGVVDSEMVPQQQQQPRQEQKN